MIPIILLLILWATPANAVFGIGSSGGPTGGGGGGFTPTLEDEFVGPFASWTNVKTSCSAVGDGVADDTNAIQTCLNNLKTAGAGTLYFPAGTYKITSGLTIAASLQGVQIIGADPVTTIIKWAGSSGGVMMTAIQFKLSKVARLTWDGSSVAATGFWSAAGSGSSTNMLHEDEFFQNFNTGLLIGNNSDDNDVTILRCHFTNNVSGIRVDSYNAVNVWAWFSTFSNNTYAINGGGTGSRCGMIHAYYSDFFNSSALDIAAQCNFTGVIGNFSSGSKKFLQDFNGGTNPDPILIMDNVIVGTPSNTVISGASEGPLKLLDNKISNTTGVGPLVSMSNGVASLISVGNTYSIPNEYSCSGGSTQCWQLNDTVGTVSGSAYNWPTAPNLGRNITDLSPGATAATVQAAINSAITNQGHHPVVHFPAGSYPVSTTLTIPANLDIQLIGDGNGSVINFTGTVAVFKCLSPCKMLAKDFQISGNMADGFLIGTEDSTTSRVQARELYTQNTPPAGNCAYLNEGLANTLVNTYGAQVTGMHMACVIGTGSSASSVLTFFGSGGGEPVSPGETLVTVSNDGNILWSGVWFEGYAPHILDFESNTGNFAWDGGMYAPYSQTTDSLTLNNFSGNLYMSGVLPGFPTTSGYINVPTATSATNALFLGNMYNPTNTYWNVTSGGNVYGKQNLVYNSTSGYLQTPDMGGTPSSTFLLNSLAPIRTTLPSANWSLPVGVTDARIEKIEILNVTNAVHVKTGF